jgi:NADPH-dependent curcumin reductase CurA
MSQLSSNRSASNHSVSSDRLPQFLRIALSRRVLIRGFIIFDYYATHFEAFKRDMSAWLANGQIKYREHVVAGLEAAPEAFIGLLQGANFGKLVVRVGIH